MEEILFRHEYKHQISYADAVAIRARALAVMKHDGHTMPNGLYFIRSLYFDNCDDKALRGKEDGISRREKFRIRFYNRDDSFIRLEKSFASAAFAPNRKLRSQKNSAGRYSAGKPNG